MNGIKVVLIEEEMQSAYLDYSVSVIVSRALPDVRDGLKPVHRRIIYAMNEVGNQSSKPLRKSARIVGEVMGKYHPHGDAAIYETMVRLAQWFSMRTPLIEGQGNFGSMDGDGAAASRYTEARMAKIADMLVADIDYDTVDFLPNYDNSLQEPSVLPARFPNLLVNGSNGIAVGMATYIPTHNLGEVIDACCAVLEQPDISLEELIKKYIPGPDFPTGGIILGQNGILESFKTGKGTVLVRAKAEIINNKSIIINEVPFQVNKARIVEHIAELIKNKTITGISDIRDESNKDGVRIVIEIKKEEDAQVILNQLFKYTQLQTNISYNMLALVKNKPVRLGLREIIDNFLEFRQEVVIRRCKFLLNQNRKKAHILVGFCMALNNIDRVINIVKTAADKNVAKTSLMAEGLQVGGMLSTLELIEDEQLGNALYKFTDSQSLAILDLKLNKLTSLEQDKIKDELRNVSIEIKELLSILGSKDKIKEIIKKEMIDIKEQFSSPRLTQIEQNYEVVEDEDLIQQEDIVITYTMEGYIKRVPLDTYRTQNRGGRGKSGIKTKESDIVKEVIIANTHDIILCFSTLGRVYQLKAYQIPACLLESKGRALINLLPLSETEQLSKLLVVPQDYETADKTLVFITSFGNVRRNKFSDFTNIQSNGKIAIKLENNEKLVNVLLANNDNDLFIATKNGICNRFSINKLRIFASRSSNGVRGIKLKDSDEVISAALLNKWELSDLTEREEYFKSASALRNEIKKENNSRQDRMMQLALNENFILTVTSNGFGQLSSCYDYRPTSRGTQGFKNISLTNKNGFVIDVFPISPADEFIIATNNGRVMRCGVNDIRITKRGAQGVILFKLANSEQVVSISKVDNTNLM